MFQGLSAVIQKFDYVFFPDTLNKTVGATDRSPEQGEACLAPTTTKFVDWFRKIRYTIYEFMYQARTSHKLEEK